MELNKGKCRSAREAADVEYSTVFLIPGVGSCQNCNDNNPKHVSVEPQWDIRSMFRWQMSLVIMVSGRCTPSEGAVGKVVCMYLLMILSVPNNSIVTPVAFVIHAAGSRGTVRDNILSA